VGEVWGHLLVLVVVEVIMEGAEVGRGIMEEEVEVG